MIGKKSVSRMLAAFGLAAFLGVAIYYSYWPDGEPRIAERPLVEVTVPPLAPIQKQGRTAFEENCAACHGENAAGRDGSGPPLIHRIYEPNHHGDQAFFLAAKNGVRQHHWRFGNMPPVDGIEDKEIEHIVAYVRRLQKANGIF